MKAPNTLVGVLCAVAAGPAVGGPALYALNAGINELSKPVNPFSQAGRAHNVDVEACAGDLTTHEQEVGLGAVKANCAQYVGSFTYKTMTVDVTRYRGSADNIDNEISDGENTTTTVIEPTRRDFVRDHLITPASYRRELKKDSDSNSKMAIDGAGLGLFVSLVLVAATMPRRRPD